MESSAKRLFWLDLIRAFACVCVMLCHFNAEISANFTLDKGIGWNFPLDIYVGTFGTNLFFMISGATLMYVRMKKGKERLGVFYKKRFLAIYPMYWIAYFIALGVSLFVFGWLPSDSIVWMLNALSGFNGYLFLLELTPFAFYQIGEWFLGCIICLYIIAPFLMDMVEYHPKKSIVICILAYILLLFELKIPTNMFVLYVPHLMIGMLSVRYLKHSLSFKGIVLMGVGIILLYLFPYRRTNGEVYSLLVCTCLFLIFREVGLRMKNILIKDICSWIAKYSYAIFLVHHKLIALMALRFDLPSLGKRDVGGVFGVYCVLTAVISVGLFKLNGWVINKISYYLGTMRSKRETEE